MSDYTFSAGRAELLVFDNQDGGVSLTLQSRERGFDDYHVDQCRGDMSRDERIRLANRLNPPLASDVPELTSEEIEQAWAVIQFAAITSPADRATKLQSLADRLDAVMRSKR